MPGATTIIVRTTRVDQGDELIQKFPEVRFSKVRFASHFTKLPSHPIPQQTFYHACAVIHIRRPRPKTISIIGPVPFLLKLQCFAGEQGLLVQEMHLRGKVHNGELARELCQLCNKMNILRLP